MKYALIGCGRIATNHMRAALENNLKIVAVCDLVPQRMHLLLEKHGLQNRTDIRCYENYVQMLDTEEPELVAIATESGCHGEIALACIARSIPVIIEKPMAMSMSDAREIVRKSEENGVCVAACHQNRFNIAVQETRRAVESGRFGKLSHGSVNVRWNRNRAYYEQASWRGTWTQDGGALMNQCIHGIDLLRWMLGDEAEVVYGVTRRQFHPYLEAEDVGVAVIQFHNGAVATIEGTTNVYPHNLEETLCIFGQNGTVKLGGSNCNAVDVWQFADGGQDDAKQRVVEEVTNVYGNGHVALYADMIDAVKSGRSPYVDALAGLRALELVLAIYKSQKTGEPVYLPLENFSAREMEGQFGGGLLCP